jgi:ribosomal protein S18 acetylase RimI-like enzyme
MPAEPATKAAIRTFTKEDITFALTRTARESWDNTAAFFEICLTHDPDGCFIAEIEGQRVGMATTTRYARTGWVGNLIILPEHRRRGLGEKLMRHAMAHLTRQGVGTLRLEADPPGVKLYRRLGFVEQFDSPRFMLHTGSEHHTSGGKAEPLTADDLPAATGFDAECFGDDRARLLRLLFETSGTSFILRHGDRTRGYVMTQPSSLGTRIGPWVATDPDAARELLRSTLANLESTTVVLGVPETNRSAVELLISAGFRPAGSCLRMRWGEPAGGENLHTIFAIANGAMG